MLEQIVAFTIAITGIITYVDYLVRPELPLGRAENALCDFRSQTVAI
jgi:hypothetical protein